MLASLRQPPRTTGMVAHRAVARRQPWTLLLTWALGLVAALALPANAAVQVLKVGVYPNEPKVFQGPDGQISGIFGDLLNHIAQKEGWTIQPVPCEWEQCLLALKAGNMDLMPDVAFSEERNQLFDFHQIPTLLSWSELYRRPEGHVDSLLDLRGLRVAVLSHSIQADYLQNALQGLGVQAQWREFSSFEQAFEAVATGQADVVAANRFYGDLQATQFGLVSTPVLFQPVQLFFATGKTHHADVLAAIDRHLGRWSTEPESYYYQTMRRWMQPTPAPQVPKVVWWSLGTLGLLLLLAAGSSAWLRRAVARQTAKLQASEDKLATILNSVDAYIFIKDTALRYQYANRKVCELFGRPFESIQGQTDEAFFDDEGMHRIQAHDRRVIELGERVEEEETATAGPGGIPRTYLTVKLPLRQRDGRIYALCGISTDITRHKLAEQTIHQLAFYDPLTGLPNRRLLTDRLRQALAANQRHGRHGALLFVDVDNFKDLNDTLGHAAGDEFLVSLAQRLSACTRAQDTLARQGGDEFVLLIPELDTQNTVAKAQAQEVANKLLAAAAEPFPLASGRYQASVSVGIALYGGHSNDADALYQQADLALYQAKADGRNAARFFHPDMQVRVTARTDLEKELQHALQANELVLYYQPQVNAQGQWQAVEALVRWLHPQRGLVQPGEFIGVAEQSGLIVPMGRWVLQAGCRQLAVWTEQADKAHLSISVNVSAREFHQPNYVNGVREALSQTKAPAQKLKLELTESLLLQDVNEVVQKMGELQALGVRFSLDDFGTGYSSLSMLNRLPLHQLKIDQSFVRGLPIDSSSINIVKAIITLGQSLSLEVVAEGVETTAQRDALLALGCQCFQGYLYGRPAPPQ